jgi:hypothetical protein
LWFLCAGEAALQQFSCHFFFLEIRSECAYVFIVSFFSEERSALQQFSCHFFFLEIRSECAYVFVVSFFSAMCSSSLLEVRNDALRAERRGCFASGVADTQ